ncbi:MAG: adenylosuccinate lyase [Deltaproteobacteria bacterium]|nr:adenylosuccinate lyase [Deltaproteobacteria bacterium]
MIPRYSRPEMTNLWTDEAKFNKWLQIEVASVEAWSELGQVPAEAVKIIQQKAKFSVDRVLEIEKTTKHDVIAFVSAVAENIGPEGRYLHLGLTSSDVVDTGLAAQLNDSAILIRKGLLRLMEVLKEKAHAYKLVPQMGRTHGIHAEPITFGLKFLLWYEEMKRQLVRFDAAAENIAYGKISGAVGTFANIDPRVEAYICKKLGIKPDPISTQIVQRDRHAHYFTTLALIAGSIEKIATEIRHLQRTEVLEAEEFFSPGQKGSSAMPHKRNPILSENLCGLARLVRSNSVAAMENIALWHERDISHSSVERVIGPDSNILIDFMIHRLTNMLEKLIVYPENMMKNLNQLKGLIFAQQILLELVNKGLTREDAYAIVQRNAMRTWQSHNQFQEELWSDAEVQKHFSKDELSKLFDATYHLKNVDFMFERVLGK